MYTDKKNKKQYAKDNSGPKPDRANNLKSMKQVRRTKTSYAK